MHRTHYKVRRAHLASVLAKLYMFEGEEARARQWARLALQGLQQTCAPGAEVVSHMQFILADTAHCDLASCEDA